MKNTQKGFVLIVLLVIITVVVIGGGVYFYKKNKTVNTTVDVSVQDTTTIQNNTNATDKKVNTNTSSSPAITWKTYTNTKYKFSFSYPSNYKLVTDAVKMDYDKNTIGEEWYRVELSDNVASERPVLLFEVNPDGYGPIFADKTYKVQANSKGGFSILSVQTYTPDEYTKDGQMIITVPSTRFSDGNTYYFRFSFNESGNNLESIFKQIVTSFRLTAPVSASNDEISTPVIYTITPNRASIGTTVELRGKGFSGFENDKYALVANSEGVKGIIYGDTSVATNEYIRFKLEDKYCTIDTSYSGLPCPSYLNIIPGIYTIYVYPWNKKSNSVQFTVIDQ